MQIKLVCLLLLAATVFCQDTEPQPDADIGQKRDYMLARINQVRQQQNTGLSQMYLDDTLNSVAQAHSEDMCARNFFSHVNPDGKSPDRRLRDIGLIVSNAENIAMGQTLLQMHTNLMNSPGHFANTIGQSWTRAGVGISMCKPNQVYLTIVFASRDFVKFPFQESQIGNLRQQISQYLIEISPAPRTQQTVLSGHVNNWFVAKKQPSSIFQYFRNVGYQSNGFMTYRNTMSTYSSNFVSGLRSRRALAQPNTQFTKFGVGLQVTPQGMVEVGVVYIQ